MQPDPARLQLAESILAEAVYRSRERQAAGFELRRGASPAAGSCGLGEKAAVELADALWPAGLAGARLEEFKRVVAEWVVEQDALDRKRNHYLRDFRQKHGFDRTRYPAELLRDFEQGLARVNAQETERRREVARGLVELTSA